MNLNLDSECQITGVEVQNGNFRQSINANGFGDNDCDIYLFNLATSLKYSYCIIIMKKHDLICTYQFVTQWYSLTLI